MVRPVYKYRLNLKWSKICRWINVGITRSTLTSSASLWGGYTWRNVAGTKLSRSVSAFLIGCVTHFFAPLCILATSSITTLQSESSVISKKDFQYILRELGDITDNQIIDEIFLEVCPFTPGTTFNWFVLNPRSHVQCHHRWGGRFIAKYIIVTQVFPQC